MAETRTVTRDPGVHYGTDPGLGGPLFVTRAGSTIVVTDALQSQVERLGRLHVQLDDDARRLAEVDALVAGGGAGLPPAARRGEALIADARGMVRAGAERATAARTALVAAIAAYSDAENRARTEALELAQGRASLLGPLFRLMLPGLVLAGGATWLLMRDPQNRAAARDWFLAHPEVITSPAFVETVRMAVMSTDDAVGGIAGLPPYAMEVLLAAAGFSGVAGGGALVIAGGRQLGLFGETPVGMTRVATTVAATAPQGVAQHLARVPEGNQVRIERYDAPGQSPRFVVYVGPTETFSPVADSEPWDLSSNVNGVAGLEAGSLRATELAMRDAGITSDDPVQFVGFSQGGLLATRLAASPEWNAAGLETFGAPAGNIVLPAGIDGMAVRNSDDFIPALAGPQLDHHLLQVERQAFAPGSVIPSNLAAPAHQRDAYVATASVIDQAQSSAVRDQIVAMDAFTNDYANAEGSSITVMTYHGERNPTKVLPTATSSVFP